MAKNLSILNRVTPLGLHLKANVLTQGQNCPSHLRGFCTPRKARGVLWFPIFLHVNRVTCGMSFSLSWDGKGRDQRMPSPQWDNSGSLGLSCEALSETRIIAGPLLECEHLPAGPALQLLQPNLSQWKPPGSPPAQDDPALAELGSHGLQRKEDEDIYLNANHIPYLQALQRWSH